MDAQTGSSVLVPGAGGRGWYWHRVADELTARGQRVISVDLPGADPGAGLSEYKDVIAGSVRRLDAPITLVAQSLAGFSAPLVCEDLDVKQLILVNAMIPMPGETAGEWWANVGWEPAARAAAEQDGRPAPDLTDPETLFFHDLPDDVASVMRADAEGAKESPAVFGEPWPLEGWPAVETVVIASEHDRLFPPALQRVIARQRLGLPVETLPGGHLVALSQPRLLAEMLVRPRAPARS